MLNLTDIEITEIENTVDPRTGKSLHTTDEEIRKLQGSVTQPTRLQVTKEMLQVVAEFHKNTQIRQVECEHDPCYCNGASEPVGKFCHNCGIDLSGNNDPRPK